MPTQIRAEEMPRHAGAGWQEIVLADPERVGIPGLRFVCWRLEPGATGPEGYHGNAEGFLYVSRGDGTIWVNGSPWPLAPETVVWLEPGDGYRIRAGDAGVELLYVAVPRGAPAA